MTDIRVAEGKSSGGRMNVAIVGLGYVGLPLALLFVKKGFTVLGIDVDKKKIDLLNQGFSYLPDIHAQKIKEVISTNCFFPTTDISRSSEAEAVILCVPTPLNSDHTPDLTYLRTATEQIGLHLRQGQLIVLESSTYPGTTREELKPILEYQSNLSVGTDFYIGYSPERIDPGNKNFEVEHIPKVVSGLTEDCARAVYDLYNKVFEKLVPVSSPEVAEMTKLLENSHRLINISFINELAIICDMQQIDIWEVIRAAKTKPFGFTSYYPGPGIGGHCIPVDPLYLQWKAQKFGTISRFIQLSDEINKFIPIYIAQRITELIQKRVGSLNPHVLIYGVAYKKDINDVRESPALELIEQLQRNGITVSYHDPFINEVLLNGIKLESVELSDDLLRRVDCVLIFTDHSCIPIDKIINEAKLIFDTRNATDGKAMNKNVVRLGVGNREERS